MAMLQTLLGIIVGGYITYRASKEYYEKASKELNEQSQKLLSVNNLILRALEEADLAEYTKDEDGNIIGLVIKLKQSINASTTASAKATKK